jgi:hypothetical protein
MKLDIIDVGEDDITSYRCVAKNSLGETDGKIRLYGEDFKTFHVIIVSLQRLKIKVKPRDRSQQKSPPWQPTHLS